LLPELGDFGVGGKLSLRAGRHDRGAGVIARLHGALDLLEPAGLAFRTGLLLPPLLHPFFLELQAGILAVDGAQDLPLRQRLPELPALLVVASLGDDRIHQVALFPRRPELPLEMRLAGVGRRRLLQDVYAPVEIRLGAQLAVDLGDPRGDFLPLLLLDIEFQRLEQACPGNLARQSLTTASAWGNMWFAKSLRASA